MCIFTLRTIPGTVCTVYMLTDIVWLMDKPTYYMVYTAVFLFLNVLKVLFMKLLSTLLK